jgi:hypothetical protein
MTDRRRNVRASDADREQVIDRLRNAADEGRLVVDEFDERLGQALTALTYGELDAIVSDLPSKRAVIKRPGCGKRVLRRPHLVRRTGRAGIVLRAPRPAALIAGALATVAVAVPLTLTGAGASRPPVIEALVNYTSHAGTTLPSGYVGCTNHWTTTSVSLPCTWRSVGSRADASQIVSDVLKADNRAGLRIDRR